MSCSAPVAKTNGPRTVVRFIGVPIDDGLRKGM